MTLQFWGSSLFLAVMGNVSAWHAVHITLCDCHKLLLATIQVMQKVVTSVTECVDN